LASQVFDDDGNGYVDDIYGWDFWANDADPEDYSPVSHGTHIAGTIAASGNNNDGITGINWNASIMALRIGGIIGVISDASEAIYYAVDNGATIINASWGSENFSQTLYDAIQYADNNGVLFIAAAGNEGADNDIKKIYPSNYDIENIISVSATDQDDKIAEFSNYGPTTVDIAAPGVNIYSTSIDLGLASKTVAYSENFDPQPSGWKAGGNNNSWSFATNTGRSNSGCLEDSPGTNYKNNVESFVFNENSINILKDNLYTFSFWLKNELEADNDRLFFIVSTNGSDFVLNDDYWTGNSGGYFNRHEISFLPELVAEFYFGFFMTSDSSGTYDGVYIDDIEVYRQELIIDDFDFEHKDGTSMAAPHISGVAGLIKAQNPDYSHYEIRDAILHTVEKKPSLSGKIISEGRVNAFNAVTYLAAPKDLKAEPGDKIVILSWDANVEEACSGYKIYYVESSSESDANTLDAGTETYNGAEEACRGCKIYETVSARAVEGTEINVGDQTYYEVSGLTNGVAYDFYVWATGNFDGLGNIEAPYSTYVSATPFSLETQGNNIPSPEVGEEGGGGGCFISNIRCSF
jgi:subtilisin family serine protease